MEPQLEERLDSRHGPAVRELLDELASMLADDEIAEVVEVARRLLRARQHNEAI